MAKKYDWRDYVAQNVEAPSKRKKTPPSPPKRDRSYDVPIPKSYVPPKRTGGAKAPPSSRRAVTDDAKIWATKQFIQPWQAAEALGLDKKKPPPPGKFPSTFGLIATPEQERLSRERRRRIQAKLADDALIDPGARRRFIRAATPEDKMDMLTGRTPIQPKPEGMVSSKHEKQFFSKDPRESAKGFVGVVGDVLKSSMKDMGGDVLANYERWMKYAYEHTFDEEQRAELNQLQKEALATSQAGGRAVSGAIESSIPEYQRRRTERNLQTMGVDPETTKRAAGVIQNFVRNVSEGVVGLAPGTIMLATQPKSMGGELAKFYADFYAPLLKGDITTFRKNVAENPDMALDWLGGLGIVAGTGRRIGAATRAARNAEAVGATRVGAGAKGLVTGKEPIEIAPITAPGEYRWGKRVQTRRYNLEGEETNTQRYIPRSALGTIFSDAWDRLPRTAKMQGRRHRKGIREQVEADRSILFGEVEGFRANARKVDADPTQAMAFDRMLIYGGDATKVAAQIRREIAVRQKAIQDLADAGEEITPARIDEVQRLDQAAAFLEAGPNENFMGIVDQGRTIAGRTEEFLKEAGLLHPMTAERMLLHPVRFLEEVPEISSPSRTHIEEMLTEAVERAAPGLDVPAADPRVTLSMRWLDANAVSWARRTGRDPADFYDDLYSDAAVYEHEDMNDFFIDEDPDVYFQKEAPWSYTISPEKARLHQKAHDALSPEADPAVRAAAEAAKQPKHAARREAMQPAPARLQRIRDQLPDVGKRREYMRWYRNIWDEFENYFGADATRALRSFLISQAAMSPADGINSLLKALEYKHMHNRWPPKGILSHKTQEIIHAWENANLGEDPAGIAAKISDFFNSAEGRQTRSFLQDTSLTGPGVVDRWSLRSVGYVDWKSYSRLVEEGLDPPNPNVYVAMRKEIDEITEAGKKRGLTPDEERELARLEGASAELKAELDDFFDMSGAPDYWQYEWTAWRLHELREHMNAERFDGRGDWTADEVQALDWFATRHEWGEAGGGWEDTWGRNTFTVIGEIISDLKPAELNAVLEETVRKTGARSLSIHSAGQHVRVDVLSSAGWKEPPKGAKPGAKPTVRQPGGAAQLAKKIADETGRPAYSFYDAGAETSGVRKWAIDVRGNVFDALSLTVKDLVDTGLLVLPTGDGGLRIVFSDREGKALKVGKTTLGREARDLLVNALDQIEGVEATPVATKMQVHGPKRRPNLALYRLDDARGVFARAASARRRGTDFRISRVASEVEAARFVDGLSRNSRAWSLSPRTVSEFTDEGYLGFLADDGNAGAAVAPDGEIVGVFNSGSFPGAAARALVDALGGGGYWLQAFDGFLPAYYSNMGFREVARLKFDETQAPLWDYQDGRPDLVFMAYAPHKPIQATTRYAKSWDEAVNRTKLAGQRGLVERPIESILTELADRGDGLPSTLPEGQVLAQWKRKVKFEESDPVILGAVRLTEDGAHLMVTPASNFATMVHENAHVLLRGTLEWLKQGNDPRLPALLKAMKIEMQPERIPVAPGRVLDEVLENMGAKGNLYAQGRRVVDDPDLGLGSMEFKYAIPQRETFEPIEFAYRAISEEEWQGAQRNGYLQSDQRMNLSMDEGTVAALEDPSYYLPGKLASDKPGRYRGRVVKIRLTDKWRRDTDGYMKTPERIPLDEVAQVSPLLEGQRETRLTAGGQEVPTMPAYRPVGDFPQLTREQQEFFANLVEAHTYLGGMPAPQLRHLMGEASTTMRGIYRGGIKQISDSDYPDFPDRIEAALKDTAVSTILEDLIDVTYGAERDSGAVFIPRVRPTSPSKIGNLVRRVSGSVTRGAITPPRRPPTQPGRSRGIRYERGEYEYGPTVVANYATQAFRWKLGQDLARDIFESPAARDITLDANGVPLLDEGYVPFVYENVPGVLRQIDEQLGMAAREEDIRAARTDIDEAPAEAIEDEFAGTDVEPQELAETIGAAVQDALTEAMPDDLSAVHRTDLDRMLQEGSVKQIPIWMRDDYMDAITGNSLLSAASRRATRDLGPFARGGLALLGTFNAMARWSMIGKGAYVTTNTVGAFTTATVHNPFWIGEIRKTADFLSDWEPADLRMLDEMVGSGSYELSQILAEEKAVLGKIGAAERELYQATTRVISLPERRIRRMVASRELKASGIRNRDDFRLFVEETKVNREAMERFRQISRHAEEGVARFRGMNEGEKWIVRRAFFVYGWLRAAFRYTARFPIEHPVLAASMNRIGNEGWEDLQEHLEREIGFRGGPIVGAITERDGERIARMIDPTTMFPFSTGMEITRALTALFTAPMSGEKPADVLSNMFSPGVEAGLSMAFGETPQGLGFSGILEQYGPSKGFQGVPGLSWIMRISDPKLTESRMYGPRTREDVVGAFFFGQLWPRDMKLDAAQKIWLGRQPLAISAPITAQQDLDHLMERYSAAAVADGTTEDAEWTRAAQAHAAYDLTTRLRERSWEDLDKDARDTQRSIVRARVLRKFYSGAYEQLKERGYVAEGKDGKITAMDAEIVDDEYRLWVTDEWSDMRSYIRDVLGEKALDE